MRVRRASKAAINAITKSLALDLKDQGITVCVLHPGEHRSYCMISLLLPHFECIIWK